MLRSGQYLALGASQGTRNGGLCDRLLWLLKYHLLRQGAIKYTLWSARVEKGRRAGTMVNQDKDRVPGETLTYSSMPELPQSASRPSVLTVRLWSAASRRLDCRTSKNNSPILCLVLDLIRSSGGIPGLENTDSLSAGFPDLRSGLLCARRIQWAVEGLTEFDSFRGAAAAILVDSGDETRQASGPGGQDWGGDPGNILLSRSICELVDGLPGVALGETTAAGCRNWSWRTTEPNASFAVDEQAVLGMIRASGRSDPGTYNSNPSVPAPTTGVSTREVFNQPGLYQERIDDTGNQARPPKAGGTSRLPILIGAAAVLVIGVVALVFALSHKAPVQSATPSSPPPAPEAQPAQPPPPTKKAPAKTTSSSKKPSKAEPKVDSKPPVPVPPPVISHCDLTEEDIQRSLVRADRYMHGGDLSDARAAYQHVLGCPSAREKAQDGLNRIQRMAAQNGSPQQ